MKDGGIEWIGEIPEGWGVRKLSDLNPLANELNYYREQNGWAQSELATW
jgi:hypothetical protein